MHENKPDLVAFPNPSVLKAVRGEGDLLKCLTMGIYDRDWVRTGQRRRPSGAGAGAMAGARGLSVTIWIVIICVGVHLVDGFLAPSVAALQQPGAWTSIGRVLYAGQDGARPDLAGKTLRFVPPMGMAPSYTLPGQGGRQLTAVPLIQGYRDIYAGDKKVGRAFYQNMPLFKRIGYFSTSRALVGTTSSGQLVGGDAHSQGVRVLGGALVDVEAHDVAVAAGGPVARGEVVEVLHDRVVHEVGAREIDLEVEVFVQSGERLLQPQQVREVDEACELDCLAVVAP